MILCAFCANAQNTQKHSVKVGDFTKLKVAKGVNVVYHQCGADSTGMAVFDAEPSKVHIVSFKNNGKGKLTLEIDKEHLAVTNLPTIHLYSQFLQEAENATDSTLTITSILPTPSFKLRLSGNGTAVANNVKATTITLEIVTGRGVIAADGECTTANLRNLGVGEIQADNLKAKDVNCSIAGTGHVGCYVDGGILNVKGMGSGKVYYRGKPDKVKMFKLGSIKAIAIE